MKVALLRNEMHELGDVLGALKREVWMVHPRGASCKSSPCKEGVI